MRKTLLLVLALTLTLTACTAQPSGTTAQIQQSVATMPQASTSSQTLESDPSPEPRPELTTNWVHSPSSHLKIDVFWYSFADTYLSSVRNAMQQQLDSLPAINATHHDCRENQTMQFEMVSSATFQGTDLLIVNIVTTGSKEAAMSIVNLAKDVNVPIIFFNREVSDVVVNSYDKCVFVGTAATGPGNKQGQAVAEFLLSGDNLNTYDLDADGEIRYIRLISEEASTSMGAFCTTHSVMEANKLLAGNAKLVPSRANEISNQYDDDGISNYFLGAILATVIKCSLIIDYYAI